MIPITLKKWLGIPHPCEAPSSIFIGLMGGVGDLISAAPSVVALKKKYPDAQITFGVGDGIFFNTIKNDPNIDHFETPFFYNVWKKRARRKTYREKYRVVTADSKGIWSFEEFIEPSVILGNKTILFENLNSKLTHQLKIKSFSVINITSEKSQYEPGNTITFIGEAEPNKNLEVIIKNQDRAIILTDDITVDATGNINYKFPTDTGFLEGTYIIMINQGDSSYASLFGIGAPPEQQLIVTMNKLNFKTTDKSIVNIVGPALTEISILVTDQSGNEKISTTVITSVDGHARALLNLNDLSSGVYTTIVLKGNLQDKTKFSVGLTTGSGAITLSATKEVYSPGERILIIGKTGANSILFVDLIDPQNNVIRTAEIFSDKNGQFVSGMFRIPIDGEDGVWKIEVSSRLDHATTEFTVSS